MITAGTVRGFQTAMLRVAGALRTCWIAAAIFVNSSVLYVTTMTPGLGGGVDSAELQHAAYRLSIVHPTGYPLYLLMTRAFIALVPFGDVAWRVNLLSALCAAGAVALVYAIASFLTRSRVAGVFAAALTATHPLVWQQATIAEVNSLNLLLVAALVYILLRWASPEEDGWRPPLVLAGLLFGLALANHRVSLLALPGALLFIVWSVREGAPLSTRSALRTLGAALLPLLLYAYIPLRDGTTVWYSNSWSNFWYQVTGESAWPVIRETLRHPLRPRVRIVFNEVVGEPSFSSILEGRLLGTLLIGGLLLLSATVTRWWHDQLWRRAVFALLGPTAGIVAAVMVVYDVDVIGDYLSMVVPLTAILAACGLAAVARLPLVGADSRPRRASTDRATLSRVALTGGWIVLFAALTWHLSVIEPSMDRSGDDEAREFWGSVRGWDGTPDAIPSGAVLLSPWDRYNEARYLQEVEGWRRDIEPVVLEDFAGGAHLDVIDAWLAQGRAVYLLEATPAVLDEFLADRQGAIWRITGRGQQVAATMEHPSNVRMGEHITLVGYTLQPERLAPGDLLRVTLFWRADTAVPERYAVFVHLLDSSGNKVGQKDDEPGHGTRPTTSWTPGETVSDSLLLAIDPNLPPGRYRLMVGMYARVGVQRLAVTGAGGDLLGDYWRMVEIEISS